MDQGVGGFGLHAASDCGRFQGLAAGRQRDRKRPTLEASMKATLPNGVKFSANRLTKALRVALADRPEAVEVLRQRCGDLRRFEAWTRGETHYEAGEPCAKDGSTKRITRDGYCWACKQRKSPFVRVGNKFDRAQAVYAPSGRQRLTRARWEGERGAVRAERSGEDLGVHVSGDWTARALPTGRVVLTFKQPNDRMEVISCAKTWLAQQRERVGTERFYENLQARADLRQVLAACGWAL
jgi:hypothetical protein